MDSITGYLRPDGRMGIRNIVAVIYLVECAHHVARMIVTGAGDQRVHLMGFPGCYPSDYAARILERVATHPNVGACLLVSLGCESFDREALLGKILESGRAAELLVIQQEGGTAKTAERGIAAIERLRNAADATPRQPMAVSELVIGTICGGSDGTSGITANPAVGRAFDRLIAAGATCIFEETGELVGCGGVMAARAENPQVADRINAALDKAERYYIALGYGSFAPGNADGGLTTVEEKSLGAYAKSGDSLISGVLSPGEIPREKGLYLLDIVPEGAVPFTFPNINDNAEIVELIASGCHMILFTTGRGSVVGSAVAPVIKICANPETFARMGGDMDIDAGRILKGLETVDGVGAEIYQRVLSVASGEETCSESMGHQEFVLTYKSM